MTMASLFFYNELMKLDRQRNVYPSDDAYHEPKEREHYEEDNEPHDEDDYRE